MVLEGAGSPAEINLRNTTSSICAWRMRRMPLRVGWRHRSRRRFRRCIGTPELLEPEDRARIRGFVINKFRGDESLCARDDRDGRAPRPACLASCRILPISGSMKRTALHWRIGPQRAPLDASRTGSPDRCASVSSRCRTWRTSPTSIRWRSNHLSRSPFSSAPTKWKQPIYWYCRAANRPLTIFNGLSGGVLPRNSDACVNADARHRHLWRLLDDGILYRRSSRHRESRNA